MKTYYIKTFGCQMNKLASARIEGDYQAREYRPARSWKEADEIVINTCSVRQRAEDRVKGFLENVKKYFVIPASLAESRRAKVEIYTNILIDPGSLPGMTRKPKIILTGCMTHHGREKLLELLPEVDEILPIDEVGFNLPAVRRDKTHAFVQISEGCNSFCSYCIVPYSRGREKSRPIREIIDEVKELVDKGYREITLLGQNVNSYGKEAIGIGLRKKEFRHPEESSTKDLVNEVNDKNIPIASPASPTRFDARRALRGELDSSTPLCFAQNDTEVAPFVKLLRKVSEILGIRKISFMTSNPWDFGDDLIDEIAGNEKIDRFIHLPVQSGSNRILKLMNRGYTRENYLGLISKLRKKVAGVQIGTDIIVGFPTETEEDFQETMDLAKKAGWIVGFVAQYSPRPGTVAERLYKDDMPAKEKKRRWEILDKIINKDNLNRRPEIK